MRIEHNEHNEYQPSEDRFFWRYMSIDKFLDLIINKRIFLSRFDKFKDPLEGATQVQIQDAAFHLPIPKTPEGINKNIPYEERVRITKERNLKIAEIRNDLEESQKYAAGVCLFKSENYESQAMWDLYADQNGVALKISEKNIHDLMLNKSNYSIIPERLIYGKVHYWKYHSQEPYLTMSELKSRYFRKNQSFDFEKEFRYVASFDEPLNFPGIFISIEEAITSFDFVTHPSMPAHVFKNLEVLHKQYAAGSKFQESKAYTKDKFY